MLFVSYNKGKMTAFPLRCGKRCVYFDSYLFTQRDFFFAFINAADNMSFLIIILFLPPVDESC